MILRLPDIRKLFDLPEGAGEHPVRGELGVSRGRILPADMAAMAADPITQRWWSSVQPRCRIVDPQAGRIGGR